LSGVDILDVDIPKPQRNEVLIKVFACGLNRADLVVADGGAHGSAGGSGTIVGMEFSGEVVEFGSDVKDLEVGDRVMCSGTAAWAEYAVTDWGRVIKIPNNFVFECFLNGGVTSADLSAVLLFDAYN
jgi:NADPH2:quinone reductase